MIYNDLPLLLRSFEAVKSTEKIFTQNKFIHKCYGGMTKLMWGNMMAI